MILSLQNCSLISALKCNKIKEIFQKWGDRGLKPEKSRKPEASQSYRLSARVI